MRKMQLQMIICLLTVGQGVLANALSLRPFPGPFNSSTVTFSHDLDPDHTPCRRWIFPCGNGIERCTTQEEFAAFQHGPQPRCPIFENPTPVIQEGTCTLVDGECAFSTEAPTCVSWLPDCSTHYSCTTEEVYSARQNGTCFISLPPPTPASVCVPVDDRCEWHNPCTTWQGHCGGEYMCGSQADFAYFQSSPFIPVCAAPDPSILLTPVQVPEGECVYRDGQCEWSRCRSWLSACRTHWSCGNEYEFQLFQSLPPPPCAPPPPFFVPPIEPGVCKISIEEGRCAFTGEVVCEGGREFQTCGSNCPRTCNNFLVPDLCLAACSAGCFCPDGTVLHNDQCIPPSQCPNPCDEVECEPNQECKLEEVQCVRAPCHPEPVCQDKATVDVQVFGSSVVVSIQSEGAQVIRVILRDSTHTSHRRRLLGSSASVTFSNLPSGVARVRARVKRTNGEVILTEWIEIAIL